MTINFGDITETSSGLMDLSKSSINLWGNDKKVTVTASASVKGSGEINLVTFGVIKTIFTGLSFDTTGIDVLDSDGNALVLNETASSLSDLAEGQYALISSVESNGGVKILYAAPVPEPSAFGMLAGLGALALVASRRRRK